MEIKRVKVITNCPHCAFKTPPNCTYCDNKREVGTEMAFASFALLVQREIEITKTLEENMETIEV